MPNPYAQIFAAPGAKGFTAAGLLGRMPVAMTNIGIITMLSITAGDYALAGAVAATFTLSMAVITPQVSRLADRFGQRRILPLAAGVSVAGLCLMLLCVQLELPAWTYFASAVPAGCMPSMSAMARARWTELYRSSPRLHTAYSFESVADELTFITGPALSVVLSTMAFAQAGPLASAAFLAVGVLLFAAQRSTEPPVRGADETTRGAGAIRSLPLVVLALTLLAGGIIVGAVDVVAVAFAESLGVPSATGIVLSAYALGSAISGLAFGALNLPWRPQRALLAAVAGTGLTTLPFLLVGDIWTLSAAVFFAGVFFAPMMILVMTLIEKVVPPSALTEGMTWALTGLTIGTATGTFAAGLAVERAGTTAGFLVTVAAGALIVVIVAVCLPMLGRAVRRADAVRGEARPEEGDRARDPIG
ncbi:MFS transporter [Nocardiopsis suaedae]|uniref:MFS transporter n=1 Tax=Nocardiopsis suaedae TaxID=3018444 RepID=A0ABT4TKW6_9ACTN|nr:MFS transporter [Nocardiopsis suaedae]MDA2805246.1 MFS transporter [Nocardiopsis suaedae]